MSSLVTKAYDIFNNEGITTLSKKGVAFIISYVLKYIVGPVVRLLSVFMPKNNNRVLIGTQSKWGFQDNPKYVYEWILENEDRIEPVWMAHDDDVCQELLERDLPVVKIHSLKGVYYLLTASVVVYTHSLEDIAFSVGAVPASITKIYLGHGDPVKGSSHSKSKIKRKKEKFSRVDYIITRSEFMAETKIERNRTEDGESPLAKFEDKLYTTGYPKCDRLLDVPATFENQWEAFLGDAEPEHVLLYAPAKHKTFVEEYDETTPSVNFFPFNDFKISELTTLLDEHNILLLVRPHPSDTIRMENQSYGSYKKMEVELNELCSQSDMIQMCTQFEIADTNKILPFVDILITDYSSIYHDYLLLDRPILFIPYDYEEFASARGFRYNYYDNLPGPAISSFEQFKQEVTDICEGIDVHHPKRAELRDKVHQFKDSGSSKRVAELILAEITAK